MSRLLLLTKEYEITGNFYLQILLKFHIYIILDKEYVRKVAAVVVFALMRK